MESCQKNIAKNPPLPKQYADTFLIIDRGEGSFLFDAADQRYLDFTAGIAVNALGYGRRDLLEAACRQLQKVTHTSNLFTTEAVLELAFKLTATGNFSAVHLGNSGAEANEAAIKYARLYAWRNKSADSHKIMVFGNGFHGRTMGSLACTPNPKYQEPFNPILPGVITLPYNDSEAAQKELDSSFAAVLVEPVQGEGGLEVISGAFAACLNDLCRQHDVLLIADEVQTGVGRGGEFYASAATGLKPDIITLAKPLGGGLPLSATLIPAKVNDLLQVGQHGSTFGGNPVAAAVANKVIDEIFRPDFLKQVRQKGVKLQSGLAEIAARYPWLGRVKGLGLLVGLEVTVTAEKQASVLQDIIGRCRDKGLLILRSGANLIRLTPPLTVSEAEIEQALAILAEVFNQAAGKID